MSAYLETLSEQPTRITEEKIREAYELLGLNDPAVRRYYENLRSMNEEEGPQIWLRTSHHTVLTHK